jgi:hypothetical protein
MNDDDATQKITENEQVDSSIKSEVDLLEKNEDEKADESNKNIKKQEVKKEPPVKKDYLFELSEKVLAKSRETDAHLLHHHLKGVVELSISNPFQKIYFDWRENELKIYQSIPATLSSDSIDCTIEISLADLKLISDGTLNPQVAMLSERIIVKGSTPGYSEFSVFFFNLFC